MLSVTKAEEKIKAGKLADELSEQYCVTFWKLIKELNGKRLPTANSDGNISSEVAVAAVWRDHYESILSYVDQSKYKN